MERHLGPGAQEGPSKLVLMLCVLWLLQVVGCGG